MESNSLSIYNNGYSQINIRKGNDGADKYAFPVLPTIIASTINACAKTQDLVTVPLRAAFQNEQTFMTADEMKPPFVIVTDREGKQVKGRLLQKSETTALVGSMDGQSQAFISNFSRIECGTADAKSREVVVTGVSSQCRSFGVSYLASGITWEVAYMCTVTKPTDNATVGMNLVKRAILRNNTGVTFKPTQLNLITGNIRPPRDINRSQSRRGNYEPERMRAVSAIPMMKAARSMVVADSEEMGDSDDLSGGVFSSQSVLDVPQLGPVTQVHMQTMPNVEAVLIHKLDIPSYSSGNWTSATATTVPMQPLSFGYLFQPSSDISPGQACFYQFESPEDMNGVFVGSSDLSQHPKNKTLQVMVGTSNALMYAARVEDQQEQIVSKEPKKIRKRVTKEVHLRFNNKNIKSTQHIILTSRNFPTDPSSKFTIKFDGPYRVAERISDTGAEMREWQFDIRDDKKDLVVTVSYIVEQPIYA